MKLFNTIALCLLAAVASFQSVAGDNDWEKIADKTVSFKSETDTVNPLSPFANARFSHIKIKCQRSTNSTLRLRNRLMVSTDLSVFEIQANPVRLRTVRSAPVPLREDSPHQGPRARSLRQQS